MFDEKANTIISQLHQLFYYGSGDIYEQAKVILEQVPSSEREEIFEAFTDEINYSQASRRRFVASRTLQNPTKPGKASLDVYVRLISSLATGASIDDIADRLPKAIEISNLKIATIDQEVADQAKIYAQVASNLDKYFQHQFMIDRAIPLYSVIKAIPKEKRDLLYESLGKMFDEISRYKDDLPTDQIAIPHQVIDLLEEIGLAQSLEQADQMGPRLSYLADLRRVIEATEEISSGKVTEENALLALGRYFYYYK